MPCLDKWTGAFALPPHCKVLECVLALQATPHMHKHTCSLQISLRLHQHDFARRGVWYGIFHFLFVICVVVYVANVWYAFETSLS